MRPEDRLRWTTGKSLRHKQDNATQPRACLTNPDGGARARTGHTPRILAAAKRSLTSTQAQQASMNDQGLWTASTEMRRPTGPSVTR
jgi:hypothetical protein